MAAAMLPDKVVLKPEGSPPTFTATSPALAFNIHSHLLKARAATLHLPHGSVRTPVFMPVGESTIFNYSRTAEFLIERIFDEFLPRRN